MSFYYIKNKLYVTKIKPYTGNFSCFANRILNKQDTDSLYYLIVTENDNNESTMNMKMKMLSKVKSIMAHG